MSIAAFSIRRRVTILMAVLGVVVFGWFSLNRLELKLLPEITYPTLTVRTELEGAPPEELEDLVSRPVEEALSTINNLEQITSISRAGLSDVVIEFHWNTSMDKALMDIREKLDRVILPDSADRPRILRYNPETEPVLKLSLTGENLVAMYDFAEKEIKPRLETVQGVAAVSIMGGDQEEILIEIDTRKLSALNLSLTDVAQQIGFENINQPGGMLEEGKTQYLVRTLNEFKEESDIGNIVIGSSNNVDVRLRDIAELTRNNVEKKTITHLNGQESVLLDIYKEGDANIIAVTDRIRRELGNPQTNRSPRNRTLGSMLPESMDIAVISDQSIFIRAAVKEVRSAAILGCILAVFILYLFMRNLPNTVIIGLSIPVSIVATFTLMYFKNISLNLMSLGGLAMGIGMLVDNSIVVLENIFRLKESGLNNKDAAQNGTEQVTTAVIASTLTTIAVFFPIVFVKGIAGQIFNDLAWTIAFSLLASLIVALSLIPMIASLGHRKPVSDDIAIVKAWKSGNSSEKKGVKRIISGLSAVLSAARKGFVNHLKNHILKAFTRPGSFTGVSGTLIAVVFFPLRFTFYTLSFILVILGDLITNGSWLIAAIPVIILKTVWFIFQLLLSPVLKLFNIFYNKTHTLYIHILNYSLKHPYRAPAVSIALLIGIAWLVIPNLGMNLIPTMSQGEFLIDLKLPVGSPLAETERVVAAAEQTIAEVPAIETVSSVIGSDMTSSTALGAEQEHMATIQVLLKNGYRDQKGEQAAMEQLREIFKNVSGIEKIEFRRPTLFTLKTPMEVEVRGNDLGALLQVSGKLVDKLNVYPEFKDVHSTMEAGYPEIQIVFDRVKLARLNMTPNQAAEIVRHAIEGDVPTEFGHIGEEIDIRIRSMRDRTMTLTELNHLVINPNSNNPIYLNAVATISRSIGPSEIRRIDQRRVALVRANTPMLDLKRSRDKAYHAIQTMKSIPPDIYFAVTGQTQEMQESSRSLVIALIMAVFLVYLVMASQFESLIQPFIILFSIPLALIGVLAGLYLLNVSLSAVVFIGLIVLAGIVVNNAIVLVDTTNQIYRKGTEITVAVVTACDHRLRPILMTALTTILGLLPMALSTGSGQEIRQPLALTVILGLFVSTFMTLVVIPTIYYLIHKRSTGHKTPSTQIN